MFFNFHEEAKFSGEKQEKKIESSNSTTMFRNINRGRFQIRGGKILQLQIKNLETKSSNLMLFNFQDEARFSCEKHEKMIESSNSTTMFRNVQKISDQKGQKTPMVYRKFENQV